MIYSTYLNGHQTRFIVAVILLRSSPTVLLAFQCFDDPLAEYVLTSAEGEEGSSLTMQGCIFIEEIWNVSEAGSDKSLHGGRGAGEVDGQFAMSISRAVRCVHYESNNFN